MVGMDSTTISIALLGLAALILTITNFWTILFAIWYHLILPGRRKRFFLQQPENIRKTVNVLVYCQKYWDDLLEDERILALQGKLYLEYALDTHQMDALIKAMEYSMKAIERLPLVLQEREDEQANSTG